MKLNYIEELLSELTKKGLTEEYNYIQNIIKFSEDLGRSKFHWQAVIDEIDSPRDYRAGDAAISKISQGFITIYESAQKLKELTPEEVEEVAKISQRRASKFLSMEKHADLIPGGKADQYTYDEFDPEQLAKGIIIELEHTDDIQLAMEISMDHLAEFEDYYIALEEMETNLEKEAGFSDMLPTFTKLIPFSGVFINAVLAFRNIYYGTQEFLNLMQDSERLGIDKWDLIDFRNLPKIVGIINQNKDNPQRLKSIARSLNHAKLFNSEVISLIYNIKDGLKDFVVDYLLKPISLIGKTSKFGLDIGITLIWIAEDVSLSGKSNQLYDKVLNIIRNIAVENLPQPEMESPHVSWGDMSEEEKEAYYEDFTSS